MMLPVRVLSHRTAEFLCIRLLDDIFIISIRGLAQIHCTCLLSRITFGFLQA